MQNNMQRFTQRAKRVLSLAQEAAERLQQSYIGTEHILLGLLAEEGGVAGQVLRKMGVERSRVEDLVARQSQPQPKPDIPNWRPELLAGAKKVIQLAIDEARLMGDHYIGTEHLLLGLTRQKEGRVIDIFNQMNISPDEIRRQTRAILQQGQGEQVLVSSPGNLAASSGIMTFTVEANRTLKLAQNAAETFQRNHIEPEHILIGLVREEGGLAQHILHGIGVDPNKVEELIAQRNQPQPKPNIPNWHPNWSSATKKVIEMAVNEARAMGDRSIDTEHLLLGLTFQTEGTAIDVLKEILKTGKINADEINDIIHLVLNKMTSESAPVNSTNQSNEAKSPINEPLMIGVALYRFTRHASHVRTIAKSEAHRRSQKYVGIEHVCLGFICETGCIAQRVLSDLNITQERVETVLEQISLGRQLIFQGQALIQQGRHILEGNWKTVIPDAVSEPETSPEVELLYQFAARDKNPMVEPEISTGHLLVALNQLAKTSTLVANILNLLNIDADDLYQHTLQYLTDHPNEEMSESSP